jgi:hypothetical protein
MKVLESTFMLKMQKSLDFGTESRGLKKHNKKRPLKLEKSGSIWNEIETV